MLALTAAKWFSFMAALSFAYADSYKLWFGAALCVVQAGLWCWAWRGFGGFGIIFGWVLQTLYLGVCWSYFTYFGLHLTWATVVSVGGEGATAVGHGVIPVAIGMWWLLADLPVVLWWSWRDRARWHAGWSACAGVLLVLSLGWSTWCVDGALRWAAGERDDRYTSQAVFVRQYGLLPVQLRQIWRGQQMQPLAYGPEVTLTATTADQRDVLVIQVESLDVDAIDRAMPRLAERARNGVWFTRCLAYHGPGGSSDCDVAIVEGAEPLWDAVSFDQPGYPWANSWVMRLRRAGWHPALAHGLPGMYFNFSQVMPRLGYDLWDLTDLGLVQHPGEFGARDNELVDAVLPRMAQLPSPFVMHVVTMSSHAPFTQYRAWWHGPDLGEHYANSLAATDAQLERLIGAFLARSPRGLVVLFGDHSAGLPSSDRTRGSEGQREYVPLVFLNSGEAPRRDARLASFLDVGRTILPEVGWSGPVRTWGADLLPPGVELPPTRIYSRPTLRSQSEMGSPSR